LTNATGPWSRAEVNFFRHFNELFEKGHVSSMNKRRGSTRSPISLVKIP
jgi:hypothetical protein